MKNILDRRTFKGVKKIVELYKVYDGDTIEIITKLDKFEQKKRYLLRLNGIDAPELKPKMNIENRNLHIETALKVKEILTNVLTNKLYVEFDSEDKYGRLLGNVFIIPYRPWYLSCCKLNYNNKSNNINSWLLTNNLVKSYNGKTKDIFTKDWLLENSNNINYLYNKTYITKSLLN